MTLSSHEDHGNERPPPAPNKHYQSNHSNSTPNAIEYTSNREEMSTNETDVFGQKIDNAKAKPVDERLEFRVRFQVRRAGRHQNTQETVNVAKRICPSCAGLLMPRLM